MNIEEASKIDTKLKFDDWEENWQSPLGYWIENEATEQIISISIFIKEAFNDDLFYSYEWC